MGTGRRGRAGDRRAKIFPTVGGVSKYEEFYGRGSVGQTGGITYDPFWVVQYMQWSEWQTQVCAVGNVAIERGT